MSFDEWYKANVELTIPHDMPDVARAAARALMTACWNAALDAANRATRPHQSLTRDLYNPANVAIVIENLKAS